MRFERVCGCSSRAQSERSRLVQTYCQPWMMPLVPLRRSLGDEALCYGATEVGSDAKARPWEMCAAKTHFLGCVLDRGMFASGMNKFY
jgi:hypothetical protein